MGSWPRCEQSQYTVVARDVLVGSMAFEKTHMVTPKGPDVDFSDQRGSVPRHLGCPPVLTVTRQWQQS
jgi:hypothetical protein